MKNFQSITGRALRAIFDELFFLIAAGILTLLSLLLVLPAPFAFAGLMRLAHHAVQGRGLSWGLFWDGVRRYGVRMAFAGLLSGACLLITVLDLLYFNSPSSPFPTEVIALVSGFWIFMGLLWTGIGFYLPAVLLIPEDPRITRALYLSFILLIRHPWQTLLWGLFCAVFIFLNALVPPLVILLPGLIAALSAAAVRAFLELDNVLDESAV